MINRVMLSDSYKYSHSKQYPKDMINMYNYMEARSSKIYPYSVFFGLQGILIKYLTKPITIEEVIGAEIYAKRHGVPFDMAGWVYIVEELEGNLPVKIRAVPEGSVIPNGNVLMTIESTDNNVPWVVSWLETLLMKLWYPTTIATKSYYIKQILMRYADVTIDNPFVDFSYHNFGDRGSSSVESAAIGGAAHLTQFQGTDNFNSLKYCNDYYPGGYNIAGYSIPASEHSTVTSAPNGEFKFYDRYIEEFKDYEMVACVMDSYNVYEAVNYITSGERKSKIESDNYPIFVIRPDSGEPIEVIHEIINIMEQNRVKFFKNLKGFKVFEKYRIIWGDGITPETIQEILNAVVNRGYSSENISFGSGGDLMQNVNRDTLSFAIKCSNITIEYEDCNFGLDIKDIEVFKNPVTDQGKVSKKGKITTYYNENTKEFFTDTIGVDNITNGIYDILRTVYENGKMIKKYTLDEVRNNSIKRM